MRFTSFLLAFACVAAGSAQASDVSPQSRANQVPLRMKDATGKVVGRPMWVRYPYVVMTIEGKTFAVEFRTHLVAGVADYFKANFALGNIYFASFDCSGTGYMPVNDLLFGVSPGVVQSRSDGRLFAYITTSGLVETMVAQSMKNGQGDCFETGTDWDYRLPLSPDGIDLTGRFTAPFSIR